MGDILNDGQRGVRERRESGASALVVRGVAFANTASKFWSCLMDEVAIASPPETVIELSAPSGGLLCADLLSPATLLQRDLDALDPETMQYAYADGLAVLELMGPPAGVRLRLLASDHTRPLMDISLSYLDAEVFPFLLAWFLEWANLQDARWNDAVVRGDFHAEDPSRKVLYQVGFELNNRHMSEGLYQRTIQIRFQRTPRREKTASPVHP